MSIKTFTVTEPYVHSECKLGEGPLWEERTNTLFFVDIVQSVIHRIDLDVGPSSHKAIPTPELTGPSVIAEVDQNPDIFIIGAKEGFALVNKRTLEHQYVKKLWSEEEGKSIDTNLLRINDGAVDSEGRFWAGTMNDQELKTPAFEGTLYRLDADLSLHRISESVGIPNGISWTEDNKTMHWTDSLQNSIFAYDYESKTGDMSNQRTLFKTEGDAVPDGHAADVEGYLWVAIYNGSKVVRISPKGEVVAEIQLPARKPTCTVFAGEDLYITSAAESEPEKYPDSAKYGGAVFKCHVGVRGRPPHRFAYQSMTTDEQ